MTGLLDGWNPRKKRSPEGSKKGTFKVVFGNNEGSLLPLGHPAALSRGV
jgi:hypothetical protein